MADHRVMVVSGEPIVGYGLGRLIEEQPDMELTGVVRTAREALLSVEDERPDCLLVTLSLDSGGGLDALRELVGADRKLRILVLSDYHEQIYVNRLLRLGVRGYVMKVVGTNTLLGAIRCVASGQIYLSSEATTAFIDRTVTGHDAQESSDTSLTSRQLEVLTLIGKGLSTRQIADLLNRSVKTIEAHREHIKQRLGLRDARALDRYAVQWLMTPTEL